MEQSPFGTEKALNARFNTFTQRILDNDLCAAAVLGVLKDKFDSTDGLRYLGREPSVCITDQGHIAAGVQMGYKKQLSNGSFTKYIYTDLFIFDPLTGDKV